MDIRIATLTENTAGRGYLGEWGLSMQIEAEGLNILFDTGAGATEIHNAGLMGIDFKKIDRIILSHGHHDHTGGLREVLSHAQKEVAVVAHPDVWTAKHGRPPDHAQGSAEGPIDFTGVPFRREALESLGARFELVRQPFRLTDRIFTTGEIPMTTDFEEVDTALFEKKDGQMQPDKLADDLALVADTDYGLVVILGCAHRGIINTLRHARKLTGGKPVYAAIGGTHLLHASEARLEKTAAELKDMGVQYLGVSHCTGFRSSAYLARVFGDRFFLNNAGSKLALPFR